MASSIEVTFSKEKETKNTIRFQEDVEGDASPIVGTLYVKKSKLDEMGATDKVKATLEAA